jgi:hypothetical protein
MITVPPYNVLRIACHATNLRDVYDHGVLYGSDIKKKRNSQHSTGLNWNSQQSTGLNRNNKVYRTEMD